MVLFILSELQTTSILFYVMKEYKTFVFDRGYVVVNAIYCKKLFQQQWANNFFCM